MWRDAIPQQSSIRFSVLQGFDNIFIFIKFDFDILMNVCLAWGRVWPLPILREIALNMMYTANM